MAAGKTKTNWFLYLMLVTIAILGVGAWQGWNWWVRSSAPVEASSGGDSPDSPPQLEIVEVKPGSPGQVIGRQLEEQGVIRSATAWNLWTRWLSRQNAGGGYKAGIYQLSPTQPMQAIAEKLWNGEVMQLDFTIPEGWTLKDMAQYFESEGFFSAAEFLAATKEIPYAQYPWLPDNLPHLEGFLYPDTYKLRADDISAEAVIKQMLDQFERVALPTYQQNASSTDLSLLEWVTLASIVEKESVVASERGLIAGVFTNRLEKGMKLGADPTVEYGLGIKQTADRPLTWDQVETPSPYNTYLNPGLPPTPIAAPGIPSLEATLNPEETEFLYFVARYDGTHVFSRTLAEHEAAQDAIWDRREAEQQ
ncbi:endolytic transglycosylase MltG [Phormidium sp. CCY1219]|nr:endolytic transglycosylase MltG [Phormidium sp. CCY1219]